MISGKIYKIIIVLSILIFIFLVAMQMFYKVKHEMTPEGRFENYKWYIMESSEVWVKNRNNGYYDKKEAIDWYEKKNSNGDKPMNQFPAFIYKEIKNALTLTFEDYSNIVDPDSIKKLISIQLDLRKDQILENIISGN